MSFPWAEALSIGVPALVSIASASVATREARRARQSEREAERLRSLEERVGQHKYDVYKPMIEAFADAISGGVAPPDLMSKAHTFATWLTVFGADEAVIAYGRLMQSTYENAPAQILVRMYVEFLQAARHDMGDASSGLSNLDILAPRIQDLYQNQRYYEAIVMPLEKLLPKYSWQPPWLRPFAEMNDDPMPEVGPVAEPSHSPVAETDEMAETDETDETRVSSRSVEPVKRTRPRKRPRGRT